MKKAALLIGTLIALAGSALAQSNDNFKFYNETGRTITGLWCSPHNSSKWHNQLLRNRLPNDYNVEVYIRDNEDYGTDWYDLRIEYANGDTVDLTDGVNLSQVSEITATHRGDETEISYE